MHLLSVHPSVVPALAGVIAARPNFINMLATPIFAKTTLSPHLTAPLQVLQSVAENVAVSSLIAKIWDSELLPLLEITQKKVSIPEWAVYIKSHAPIFVSITQILSKNNFTGHALPSEIDITAKMTPQEFSKLETEMVNSFYRSKDSQRAMQSHSIEKESLPPTCHVCAKPATNKCSRCKSTWYCSTECQKADWQKHKVSCVTPV